MSKLTETRDAVVGSAKKAWSEASPEGRAYASGVFTGLVVMLVLALAVWAW